MPSSDLTLEQIYSALRNCYDPEMPVNIVDLGLVYDVQIQEGNRVSIKMTLTTPGCSMGTSISKDAQSKILALEGVSEAQVEIIWDPPWSQHMISEAGRKKLGMI
jgi:metal-sulfur cluster biosynthetic enzyme